MANTRQSDEILANVRWFQEVFKVTNPQPPKWYEDGQLPTALGRVSGRLIWRRSHVERFVEILEDQTQVPACRTTPAERRQAAQTFSAEREAKAHKSLEPA